MDERSRALINRRLAVRGWTWTIGGTFGGALVAYVNGALIAFWALLFVSCLLAFFMGHRWLRRQPTEE